MQPRYVNSTYFFNVCDCVYPLSLPQKNGDILFVQLEHLAEFVHSVLPKITFRFILISSMSDHTIPYHFVKESIIIEKNKCIVAWFTHNCIEPTKKRKQIPVGLQYPLDHPHIIYTPAGTFCKRVDDNAGVFWKKEEDLMVEVCESNSCERINECYGNFQFMMDTLYAWDRKDALENIPKDLIHYQATYISKKETFMCMKKYKFIVSPYGNGFDCHRTWEALVLGCIPIVHSSPLDPLFEGLPVLIVKSWSDITRELLDSFIPDTSQMEKITMRYWIQRLNSAREECL